MENLVLYFKTLQPYFNYALDLIFEWNGKYKLSEKENTSYVSKMSVNFKTYKKITWQKNFC